MAQRPHVVAFAFLVGFVGARCVKAAQFVVDRTGLENAPASLRAARAISDAL